MREIEGSCASHPLKACLVSSECSVVTFTWSQGHQTTYKYSIPVTIRTCMASSWVSNVMD